MSCQNHLSNHACKCKPTVYSQTLDEMEFERGIWSAARDGDDGRVEKLASHGGVDRLDGAGYTALHHVARAGHHETCKLLLRLGAQVDARTRSGLATPLHRASAAGKMKIVKMLIEAGANVRLKDSDGLSALHRAAAGGHSDIASYILSVDPACRSECDNHGRSPLQLARESNKDGNLLKLLE